MRCGNACSLHPTAVILRAMDEMLDIVNELDEVVGQAARGDIHRNNQMHRATHIILTNSAKQVFVQLRSLTKDTNPGLWDSSAAGHVDARESYLDCAARELEEELGIRIAASELLEIGRLPPTADNGFEFVRIYAASSDDPITLEAGEIDDGSWLSEAELDARLRDRPQEFATSFAEIWEKFRGWSESR